jgi:hypothetical protein
MTLGFKVRVAGGGEDCLRNGGKRAGTNGTGVGSVCQWYPILTAAVVAISRLGSVSHLPVLD